MMLFRLGSQLRDFQGVSCVNVFMSLLSCATALARSGGSTPLQT